MFRRSSAPAVDAVAAARRRLAALSVHHGDGVEVAPTPNLRGRDPAAPGLPDPAPETSPRHVARHAGTRHSQLGRWGVTPQHVAVVALCLALAVVVVAWWALRSVPHTEQVTLSSRRELPASAGLHPQTPVPTTSAGVAAFQGGGADAGTVSSASLVIDVAGKVRHPGIVELPQGSRVVDAIDAAGGARPGVSLISLNLARMLVDGEQIVVGVQVPFLVGAPPSLGGAPVGVPPTPTATVGLNTATAEQLDSLPGVGPVTAQAILQWRADNGPFTSVDELLDVSGIGDATLSDLRPYVHV